MLEMPQSMVERALKTMGDRWKVMIIQELMNGTKRFGEIKKEFGDIYKLPSRLSSFAILSFNSSVL